MIIVNRSIHIIDYENHRIYSRDTPHSFDEYVEELINHINTNTTVREYKTRSSATEVIGSILQIIENKEDIGFALSREESIANRLLIKEVEAQNRVARMYTNVQKGSLIQALLFDEVNNGYVYLLAKVEHSDFVDDSDFSFKTGFSKDKKTLWKSCLFELPDTDLLEFQAKVYTNTVANYWGDDFLELDKLNTDEVNTSNAFRAIETALSHSMRSEYLRDHTIIRNGFIIYFKNNEHIDYPIMVHTVLGDYDPIDMPVEKFTSLREKILELPAKKHFDQQFNSVKSAITARIKKVYQVNIGIELKITDGIDDIENTISAYEDNDGARYISIKTNNEETYTRFKP